MPSTATEVMPWIGLYAAAASFVWLVLVTADIVRSFRYKKLWFPCKYSALNAASLTVITVAVKLAMDLNTDMSGEEQVGKLSSTFLLQASMVYMMPSLGSMNDREKLVNLAALGILVVTLSVDVLIQLFDQDIVFIVMQGILLLLNFYLLFVLISSALTVSTNKRYLEHKYNKLRARISLEDQQRNDDVFNFEKLTLRFNKYWVMAKTGSPQFVMARSEASYILTLITSSYLPLTMVLGFLSVWYEDKATDSDYKWSLRVILVTQLLAINVCLLISFMRFLHALFLNIRYFLKFLRSLLSFDQHSYGTKLLVEWKKKPLPLLVRGQKKRKFIHLMRNMLLNIAIGCQILIVIINKLLVLLTIALAPFVILYYAITMILLVVPFLLPWIFWVVMTRRKKIGSLRESDEASFHPSSSELDDLRNFVLLLEGEKMQDKYLKFIHSSINASIMMGAKRNPRTLIELLEKSTSFRGILDIQSDQVSPIIHKEPPNCWTLPIAILTSIMIALPNIGSHTKKQFRRSVIEGFKYVCLVEKGLDADERLATSRNAADFFWAGVELRHKWQDLDLQELASQSESYLETLQTLARRSEEILNEFTNEQLNGDAIESPMDYPCHVIAANSMYKMSHNLMLDCAETTRPSHSDTDMFDKLSIMVADILAACLTNVPHIILIKCENSTIEQREQNVEEAAILWGETRGLLRALQRREISIIPPRDQLVYIDEWRAFLLKHIYDNGNSPTDSSENIASGDSMETSANIASSDSMETSAVEDHRLCMRTSMDELMTIASDIGTNEERRDPHGRLEEGEDCSYDNHKADGQL